MGKQRCKTLKWDEWHVMTSCRMLQGTTAVVVSTAVVLLWRIDVYGVKAKYIFRI